MARSAIGGITRTTRKTESLIKKVEKKLEQKKIKAAAIKKRDDAKKKLEALRKKAS